jgi:hypothetical protein
MNYIIAFLAIGAGLYLWSSIKIAAKNPDTKSLKTEIRNWAWWVAMVVYAIFWPMVIGTAFYKAVRRNT